MALPCYEQRQIAQPAKRETAMPAGKTPPPIMQHMVIGLGADFKSNQLVRRRARRRLTACNQVWSRSAYGVLYYVGEEKREQHADEPAEDSDVDLVCSWADE